MRIVSLLPALTELVAFLGSGDDLVGVTHECDVPAWVDRLPRLTSSRIGTETTSAEIDAAVASGGAGLYDLDPAALEAVAPDLILTQEQCDVCAVNEATVRRVASGLPGAVTVEAVNPTDLAGVFTMFRRVGAILGPAASDRAEGLVARFEGTTAEIRRRAGGRPSRRVALLEWLDPPYSSGHWNPEIIRRAGGTKIVGHPGARSRRLAWREVIDADPDVLILAPCGFDLDRARADVRDALARGGLADARATREGAAVVVDGSSFFARPGPRLETSLRIAAAAIDPERNGDLAPAEGEGWCRLEP